MLHITAQPYQGYHSVVAPDNGVLNYLTLALVKLAPGEAYAGETGDFEQVAVLLSGQFTVAVGGQTFTGQRRNVFEERATAVYLPPHQAFEIRNVGDVTLEVALAGSPASGRFEPFVVTPEEVKPRRVGRDNWARTVQDIIVQNGEGRVQRIVVGETINDAGNWSGYPPHKHDTYEPGVEADMEELYHFRLSPEQGFGTQLHYRYDPMTADAYLVRDGDTFMIPDGYHPVVAGAGYRLYYLWIMAGEGDRVLTPHEDPRHVWVKEAGA